MTQKKNSAKQNSSSNGQGRFNYGSSLSQEQIAQAKATAKKGHRTLNTVNKKLMNWGSELLKQQESLGSRFKHWLAYHFQQEVKEAQRAMTIAQLGNRLPDYTDQMLGWSSSALVALSKLDDKAVVRVLTSDKKWTVKEIKEEERRLQTQELAPEALATEKDWKLLMWDKYALTESDRENLRECAKNLARLDAGEGETEVEVKVGHILALVEAHKEVLLPVISHRRMGKSGVAPISMIDYGDMMRTQQLHLQAIRDLKEQNSKLLEADKERDQKSLEWARKEVEISWQRKMALVQAQLRQMEEERNQLALEKEALAAEIACLKEIATTGVPQKRESGADLEGAVVMSAMAEEERQLLVAQLQRSEEEKELLIGEKEALVAEIASLKASAGTGSDSDAGADQTMEADPQEVKEVTACFETVFGSQAVRKLHVVEVLSSLEKPVLEMLQLLVEGLRRYAKFKQPYGNGNVRQKAPEFEDDFGFVESQIPENWEPA
ncbi:MAG: hypothetical protein MUC60_06230 [Oscillatoria sp. Prado101]|jgi:hypothetical protein|nr:hypothetical protein [Oscillatoria sp. Prado101]